MDGERDPLLATGTKAKNSIQGSDTHEHVSYGRRWGILGVVSLLQLSNAIAWVSYAPAAQLAAEYYHTSCEVIDGLSLIFMAISIPGTFVSAWAFKNFGLRRGLVISAGLNALGAAIRCLGNLWAHRPEDRLLLQFVGQGLCAAAQPFALGCTTLLAQTWFGDDERAIANSLSSLANPIGIAVGSVLVPSVATSAEKIPMALMATLVPAVVTFFVTFFGMQAKPPTPPSASAEDHEEESFVAGLHRLFGSWQYWLIFMAFGIGVGIFNAVATLMSQILVGQQYTEDDAGLCSAILIGAGIFGAAGAGVLLDHTKWFLGIFKTCFIFATASFALFSYYQEPNQLHVIMGVTAVMGFFCFALLPVALELGVEITYPTPEATSSGFLWLSGQVFGITFTLVMNSLKGKWLVHKPVPLGPNASNSTLGCDGGSEPQTMEGACWFMVGAGLLATVFALPLYTRYVRLEIEREEEAAQTSRA
eukprot:m.38900 g.38900  ORF g.38900 m.38900 type:complete len:476 (-) comp7894_c0_seq1:1441-2868(-)